MVGAVVGARQFGAVVAREPWVAVTHEVLADTVVGAPVGARVHRAVSTGPALTAHTLALAASPMERALSRAFAPFARRTTEARVTMAGAVEAKPVVVACVWAHLEAAVVVSPTRRAVAHAIHAHAIS